MNKESSPKVHLYKEATLEDVSHLLGITSEGEKFKVTFGKMLSSIMSIDLEVKELKGTLSKLKMEMNNTKKDKNKIDLDSTKNINMLRNKAIEKNAEVGTIYTDGINVRIKTKNGWEKLITAPIQ